MYHYGVLSIVPKMFTYSSYIIYSMYIQTMDKVHEKGGLNQFSFGLSFNPD